MYGRSMPRSKKSSAMSRKSGSWCALPVARTRGRPKSARFWGGRGTRWGHTPQARTMGKHLGHTFMAHAAGTHLWHTLRACLRRRNRVRCRGKGVQLARWRGLGGHQPISTALVRRACAPNVHRVRASSARPPLLLVPAAASLRVTDDACTVDATPLVQNTRGVEAIMKRPGHMGVVASLRRPCFTKNASRPGHSC